MQRGIDESKQKVEWNKGLILTYIDLLKPDVIQTRESIILEFQRPSPMDACYKPSFCQMVTPSATPGTCLLVCME